MRRLIPFLALLVFLASPVWGAGNASEELCDNPGSGVTCHCSEPLTKNDGTKTGAFNPTGSTGSTQCLGGSPFVVNILGSGTATWVTGASKGLTVGGDGYVMQAETNSTWRLDDSDRDFTNKTWCQRYYEYWDPAWDCNNDCNFKGPRWMGANQQQDIYMQTQSGIGSNGSDGIHWVFAHGSARNNGLIERCQNGPQYGCSSLGHLRRSWDEFRLEENLQTGWIRNEVCFDHNLSGAQVDELNTLYGSILQYPGANHLYMRVKLTQITSTTPSLIGNVGLLGPGYQNYAFTTIRSGNEKPTRLWSSGVGNPQSGIRGKVWLSYVMVAMKAAADPEYWIGAAIEVEERTPDGVLAQND